MFPLYVNKARLFEFHMENLQRDSHHWLLPPMSSVDPGDTGHRSRLLVALDDRTLAGRLAAHHVQISATAPTSSSLVPLLIGLLLLVLLGCLFVAVVVDSAELFGQDQDAAVGVDDLGLEIGVFQVGAVGDGPVVGQQDRIGILDVGEHRVGEAL